MISSDWLKLLGHILLVMINSIAWAGGMMFSIILIMGMISGSISIELGQGN